MLSLIRFLQIAAIKLVALLLLLGGLLVVAYHHLPAAEPYKVYIESYLAQAHGVIDPGSAEAVAEDAPEPDPAAKLPQTIFAGVAAFIGLLMLLPKAPKRQKKTVRFKDRLGYVEVNLASVQVTMNRVINALPEVKSVHINIKPTKDLRKVEILASGTLYKDGTTPPKQIQDGVRHAIQSAATNLIGEDAAAGVDFAHTGWELRKDLDVLDIVAISGPLPDNALTHMPETDPRWSQDTGYVPGPAVGPAGRPRSETPEYAEDEEEGDDAYGFQAPEAPRQEAAPPEPPPADDESPFSSPKNMREPVDTIDNLLLVDDEPEEPGDEPDDPTRKNEGR